MSYVAEPYAQFVQDLLTSLTGGVVREAFVYAFDEAPFRLSPPGPIVPSSLRVYGQFGGAFVRFVRDTDFTLTVATDAQRHADDYAIQWKAQSDGSPAAGATLPEEGTPFYVNYDHTGPSGASPLLSDRNPGSVIRLLAESFAREYAVVSRQLEAIYNAAFLDTSSGRDLDQLVALLGLVRRSHVFAVGSAIFTRATPAPADIFVPEGTKMSTREPPAVVFETTADGTLKRGDLSIEVGIRAEVGGATGAVAAGDVSVIHRPILGIESVSNPQATQLLGADESDDELRMRARRALETGGKATLGAMVGALSTLATVPGDTLPQVREKDILIQEDHTNRPGVVFVSVAAALSPEVAQQAVQLIEETRPAGVRVVHNFDAPSADAVVIPGGGLVTDDEEIPADATAVTGALFFPVKISAAVIPVSATLSPADRDALAGEAEASLRATVAQAGVGETLIYNRLVASLMTIDGVLDVAIELFKVPDPTASPPEAPAPRHMNLRPPATLRPSVETANGGVLEVRVGGELVTLDVTVTVVLKNTIPGSSDADNLENARVDISSRLRDKVNTLEELGRDVLVAAIGLSDSFTVASLGYTVWYREAGIQIAQPNPAITPRPDEILWVNSVKLSEVAS
jgi:Baseplate J-like protein